MELADHKLSGVEHSFPALKDWSLREGIKAWNCLMARASNATLYHREPWLELLRKSYRFDIRVKGIEGEDGELEAACVMARSKNPFVRRWIALPFSDQCPPLARSPQSLKRLIQALTAGAIKSEGFEIRGLEPPLPWQTVNCFSNWKLDMARQLPAIERGLKTNFRNNVRRAKRNSLSLSRNCDLDHLERFYALQIEARRRRGLPVQPRRFFLDLHDAFGSRDQLEVWLISQGSRDVAGAVLICEQNTIHYKWAARLLSAPAGANHLLLWSVIEEYAGRVEVLDLGRADIRNQGLNRFKHELGGLPYRVTYAFLPKAPAEISPEVLTGSQRILAQIWRRLPIRATRTLSAAIYGYLG